LASDRHYLVAAWILSTFCCLKSTFKKETEFK